MKEKIIKNSLIFASAIIVSIILTIAVAGFGWSFRTFSDMLSYSAIVVLGYGAYTASNMSNLFTGMKRNLNERYSSDEKKAKDDLAKAKLIDGWMMIGTGGILLVLSMIAIRV